MKKLPTLVCTLIGRVYELNDFPISFARFALANNASVKMPANFSSSKTFNASAVIPPGVFTFSITSSKSLFRKNTKAEIIKSINKFLETDFEGQPQWFDVTDGQYIQGLYLKESIEQRIYIVTIAPELDNITYTRWPKIISG